MIKGHIHRIFVTRDKQVVGVLTAFDMLKVIRDS
jgi:signal-transduction protein with cAMP-binding, CBS, and nucleotidyltransferase domain